MSLFNRAKPTTTHLDASVRAEGSLSVPGDLDLYGTIKGGPIEAKKHITIHARATASGPLKSHSLLVEPGARYRGKVTVGPVPTDLVQRFGRALGLIK